MPVGFENVIHIQTNWDNYKNSTVLKLHTQVLLPNMNLI